MTKKPFDAIEIDGFRGLKHLRLEGLGLINILVGGNNSGKTSILEAVSILCNPSEPMEWLSMIARRDFGRLDETRIQSLRWCFAQTGRLTDPDAFFEAECVMRCRGEFPLRMLRVQYKDIVGEPDPNSRRGAQEYFPLLDDVPVDPESRRGALLTHSIEPIDLNQLRLFEVEDFPPENRTMEVWEDQPVSLGRPRSRENLITTETLTPYTYQINRHQVGRLSRGLFDRPRDTILELIRDFDPDVVDVKIASLRGDRPAIYLDHRRLGPAPLSIFGDALRRAVLLASTLSSLENGGVLLIDEIEAGIHVGALQRVFHWLRRAAVELDVQIFATTHSLEAVDAMFDVDSEDPGAPVVHHLDQTEHETQVKRIGSDLLLRLRRERGLDVR